MFPPVEDSVFQNNPDFANLYQKLTNVVLNPDGSTHNDPRAKERAFVREELGRRRLISAKQHLLTCAISTATPSSTPPATRASSRLRAPQGQQAADSRSQQQQQQQQQQQPSLPEPLLDLLIVLPPLLDANNPPLPQDTLQLLFAHPPLSDLETLLPTLAPIIASNLRTWALGLARIAHPSTNPSFLHRHISTLPSTLSSWRSDLSAAETELSSHRLRSLAALASLLQTATNALSLLVRALEVKHGVIARSLELRAAEVSLHARRHDADAAIAAASVRRAVYTPEAITALKNYGAHLRDAKMRGEERIRGLTAELGEYGVGVDGEEGKEKKMKEMSRVYREMTRQMDDVKRDLDRLNQG
ncbi:uncharacterized protein B0J16DRAFT_157742 [Fusarium flagelliforme]|uniref:uncharacterized protein n=1 Tax=Fusarium flagelliforme TaxID=2675880 RepID=UPI001E8EB1CE|nr:uncharacterized protein B0J16DRAFT_157742 [Fusarium flagelliforme]KAH7182937.1 hypothetical protein B0J16DRAFT_157742 [Fusarium flagelliforme]